MSLSIAATTIQPLTVANGLLTPTVLVPTNPVEYVLVGDTLADIGRHEKASAGLTATSTILLSVLVISTFGINLMLLATILASYKLRNCLLYLMFCSAAALNVLDVVLIMFFSLLYVANGHWFMGEAMCRLNAWAQQFIFLMSLLGIMLMAMERALGLLGRHLVTPKYFGILLSVFIVAANCFALPLFLPNFPVKVYHFRYLCSVGSRATISFTVLQILIYGGCLFVLLLCFGSLLRYRVNDRLLPVKPQDYGAFIMESRALQDHLTLGKLVLFIAIAYLLIQGPYICLCFFVQIRNSEEMVERYGEATIPQDVETLLSWLRFFFPFILPLLILGTCNDIWIKFTNLMFCRRDMTQTFSAWRKYPEGVKKIGSGILVPKNQWDPEVYVFNVVHSYVPIPDTLFTSISNDRSAMEKEINEEKKNEDLDDGLSHSSIYECPVCGSRFLSEGRFKKHMDYDIHRSKREKERKKDVVASVYVGSVDEAYSFSDALRAEVRNEMKENDGQQIADTMYPNEDNVLTLVATADGLQLRVPTNFGAHNSSASYGNTIRESASGLLSVTPNNHLRAERIGLNAHNNNQNYRNQIPNVEILHDDSDEERNKNVNRQNDDIQLSSTRAHPKANSNNRKSEDNRKLSALAEGVDETEGYSSATESLKRNPKGSLESSGIYSQTTDVSEVGGNLSSRQTSENPIKSPPKWRNPGGFSSKLPKPINTNAEAKLGDFVAFDASNALAKRPTMAIQSSKLKAVSGSRELSERNNANRRLRREVNHKFKPKNRQ